MGQPHTASCTLSLTILCRCETPSLLAPHSPSPGLGVLGWFSVLEIFRGNPAGHTEASEDVNKNQGSKCPVRRCSCTARRRPGVTEQVGQGAGAGLWRSKPGPLGSPLRPRAGWLGWGLARSQGKVDREPSKYKHQHVFKRARSPLNTSSFVTAKTVSPP